MGAGMSTAPLPPPAVIDPAVSIARLHGEACFDCGAVVKDLRAAGAVVLCGSTHVWQIVTCGCRRRRAQREDQSEQIENPRRLREQSRGVADASEERRHAAKYSPTIHR